MLIRDYFSLNITDFGYLVSTTKKCDYKSEKCRCPFIPVLPKSNNLKH